MVPEREESVLAGRHDSRSIKLRAHVHETGLEVKQDNELSKPVSSDVLPLARPHFLNLPNSTAGEQALKPVSLWAGTFQI